MLVLTHIIGDFYIYIEVYNIIYIYVNINIERTKHIVLGSSMDAKNALSLTTYWKFRVFENKIIHKIIPNKKKFR
jgi:hypothetical protein